MTKSELRKARKHAGRMLSPEDAKHGFDSHVQADIRQRARYEKRASRAEQHARYLDCGPAAWDDR